jgi:hypothetical protein
MTFVGNETKEEDDEFIPLKSRFLVAFLCIAFCIVSSSVAMEPSSATVCLELRLAGAPYEEAAGGGMILCPGAAASPSVALAASGTEGGACLGDAAKGIAGAAISLLRCGDPSPNIGDVNGAAGE